MNCEIKSTALNSLNSSWEEDLSRIKRKIEKHLHSFLLECPELIDFLSERLQSDLSYKPLKSLVHRVSVDSGKLIEKNLDVLLLLYDEDPLCRAAKEFLAKHFHEIKELRLNPQKADESFAAFELQYVNTPLAPFFKDIRKIFDECAYFTDKSLFKFSFKNDFYKTILRKLICKNHNQLIHRSDGHCQGAMLALAVPSKGMHGGFIQVPYGLHYFFHLYFDRRITVGFGEKFRNTDGDILHKHMPITYSRVQGMLQTDQIQDLEDSAFNKELIGRTAVGLLWGNTGAFAEAKYEETLVYMNLNSSSFTASNDSRLKLMGLYVINHLDQFAEILPKDFEANDPVAVGKWAYGIYDTANDSKPAWHAALGTLSNQIERILSLKPFIERRGLSFTNILEWRLPVNDLPKCLTQLLSGEIKTVPKHYELSVKSEESNHAFYLGITGSSFLFSDPNRYDPVSLQPMIESFGDPQEYRTFIYLYLAFWYADTKAFSVLEFSEIAVPTPQMKEYLFGQAIARRSLLLSEGTKLMQRTHDLNTRLTRVQTAGEEESILDKLSQARIGIAYIQNEVQAFQNYYKDYIEEKISKLSEKSQSSRSPSYALAIDSLKELLTPAQFAE